MARVSEADDLLDLMESMLRAQLEAIEAFRHQRANRGGTGAKARSSSSKPKRLSQTAMAYEVLSQAGQPLHILEIVQRIRESFGTPVTRDILISAVLKKVAKGQLFVKMGKNTYGLLGRD